MTAQDYWALSPVIAMAALALVLLSADALLAERMFGGRRYGSKRALSWIAVIGLAVPAFFALNLWFEWFGTSTSEAVVYGTFTADRFALFFQFLIIGATAIVLLASVPYLQQFKDSLGEFFTLLLIAAAGMMLLVGASELITIYVALETTALPAVALAALRRDGFSIEAGAKFLILSALSTALLLFGLVFLYGYTGATRIDEIVARMAALPFESGVPFGSLAVMLAVLLIVAGFGFKMAIVPWHMWVPDVYQGAPTPVAAFLSVASKAAAFAVLMRLLYSFAGIRADSEGLADTVRSDSDCEHDGRQLDGVVADQRQTIVGVFDDRTSGVHHGRFRRGVCGIIERQHRGWTAEHHVLPRRVRVHQPCGVPRLRRDCAPHGRRHHFRLERIAETVTRSRDPHGHRLVVVVGSAADGRVHGQSGDIQHRGRPRVDLVGCCGGY